MKKLFVLILSFSLAFSYAQSIKWAPTSEVNEPFYSLFYNFDGKYIGDINNSQYFIHNHIKTQFYMNDDVVFCILKVQNNQVIQSSNYFDKGYNVLNFMILDNQIAVVYVDDSLTDIHHINIDYYDPSSLQFVKKEHIYSFKPILGKSNYKQMVFSEDKSKIAILSQAINPDNDSYSFLVKVFDNQWNEIYETYHFDEFEKYIKMGDFCVTNNGTILLNINRYTDFNKSNFYKNIYLYLITSTNVSKIQYDPEEDIAFQDVKFLPNQSNPMASHLITTEKRKFNIHLLDFKAETIEDPIFYKTPSGYWKIDQISELANGNLIFALSNRGITRFSSQNGSSYVYWNKNLHILCLDAENHDLVYEKILNRVYYQGEVYLTPGGNLYITPFYYIDQNTVSILYNTDEDLPDEDELETVESGRTKNPITKIAVIDENGGMTDQILFDSKDEKGTFVPKYSYVDSDSKIKICKVKKKKVTFGSVNK